MSFESFYSRLNYKTLMLIPLAILIFSAGFLGYTKSTTGEFVRQSIDFTGGSQLTISGNFDREAIENHLKAEYDVVVREINSIDEKGFVIQTSSASQDQLLQSLKEIGIEPENFSFQNIGPALGESFFRQSILALIFALVFMSVTVWIIYRKFVPSIAIIQAAVFNLVGALAFMQLFGIELSLITFAGLLLVIGYSVDTDILLTTRMLKGTGTSIERGLSAMKTGILMTTTAIAALTVLYFVSESVALKDISSVLILALLIDIPATWITNLGILRWWRKE